jgi:membrane-associated phospholipid phosphatase
MKIRNILFKLLAAIFVGTLLFSSCQKDKIDEKRQVSHFSADIALKWYQMYLEIERHANGYRPGPAPRSLAYIGLAAYEGTNSGMIGFKSLRHLYPGLQIPPVTPGKAYHWPLVLHHIYSTLIHKFFPNVEKNLDTRMSALENEMDDKYRSEVSKEVYDRSVEYGKAVALAVWDWSAIDTYGHDYYLDPFGTYSWQANFKGPGNWVPTVPGPGKPMFPNWGKVRTFAISESEKLCQPPIQYSEKTNSAMYAQALETYNAIKDENWKDGQWIAFFWSDDIVNLTFSPGSRWIAITNQVIASKKSDLQTALVCYAKVGMALNDASVACWHSKYFYNTERPESYIKRLIDPNWEPTLLNPLTGDRGISPSFPAYPSGHSTMGGAAAEVLTDMFGSNFGMYDDCHKGRTEFNGTPRYFNNFYEMSEENAISRVPLGVHWRMDCRVGVDLGYFCGRKVNKLPWR